MVRERPAICFPELERLEKYEINIYSETAIQNIERNCIDRLNAVKSVTNLIYQKVRTAELEKRINYSKQALDVKIEEAEKQLEIKYQERLKRLESQMELDKETITIKFERLRLETKKQMSLRSISFEEAVQTSTIFLEILNFEKNNLEMVRNEIDEIVNNLNNKLNITYSAKYIYLNDIYSKSLETINTYLKQLV